jgi:tetratricopeptide (TPR) repeat protein
MTRTVARAIGLAAVLATLAGSVGCEQLDGRNRTRQGNRLFMDKQFVDAAAQYEKALSEVDSPIIHYNLALAYSKLFKVGGEAGSRVLLDVQGSFACATIPGVSPVDKQVCVKPGDKHFDACDDKNVCPSSFTCQKTQLCAIDNSKLADMSAENFQKWLAAHPEDTDTRGLMTQVWIDAEQYPAALAYWNGLLAAKPNDPAIMGSLAGISLKAGDWRKSIEWYNKVAAVSSDVSAKVAALQFIGNVAWSKLNSKSLTTAESIELADLGIGALQRAAALQPDNPKPVGLQASLFNFRGLAHGASWAAGIDRASAQDLNLAATATSNPAHTGG